MDILNEFKENDAMESEMVVAATQVENNYKKQQLSNEMSSQSHNPSHFEIVPLVTLEPSTSTFITCTFNCAKSQLDQVTKMPNIFISKY